MDRSVITVRRKMIEADSPCDGCGSTLESCKAQRGRDKTAPSWFGCCARGAMLDVQCKHVPDPAALLKLIKEIESGEVAPVPTPDEELLASIQEFSINRLLRSRVMAMAADTWPDDVPMPGGF